MPQLVYMQIGSYNVEQFELAVASVRCVEPDAEIVLYTDQLAERQAGVEVRPWRVKGAPDLARCGSTSFARLTHEKIRVMRDALQRADGFIVFSDVDIMACKPFMEAARKAAQLRPVSISSEGDGRLPVQLCSGLLILKQGDAAMKFLDLWAEHHLAMLAAQPNAHDQDAFNDLVQSRPDLQDTWGALPFMFAAAGWLYHAIVPFNTLPMVPFFFHANWLPQAEEKAPRMRAVAAVYARKSHSLTNLFFRAVRALFAFINKRL